MTPFALLELEKSAARGDQIMKIIQGLAGKVHRVPTGSSEEAIRTLQRVHRSVPNILNGLGKGHARRIFPAQLDDLLTEGSAFSKVIRGAKPTSNAWAGKVSTSPEEYLAANRSAVAKLFRALRSESVM